MRTTARRAFTLIELLTVIAIIAILAGILFPVFAKAREKAEQTQCINNVKQLGTAVNMYATDYDSKLPVIGDTNAPLYWPATLYPYTKNDQILICPASTLDQNWSNSATPKPNTGADGVSYGFNSNLNMVRITRMSEPARTVMIFDCRTDGGNCWGNDAGRCRANHLGDDTANDGYSSIGFGDGHAKVQRLSDLAGGPANPPWKK
jgi:prepilin-type N-terminal cleavage/methylation domain-containing protein